VADSGFEFRLSFAVGERELRAELRSDCRALAIVGPSGAGKSTILRALAGVERRVGGFIAIKGEIWMDSESGKMLPAWERGVGWVPQDYLLFPHLSVGANLRYAGASEQQMSLVAESLEIEHLVERSPRGLSGGERQRVALGRVMLAQPELLLLDEPFSALDRALRSKVAERVGNFAREHGIPVVLVTHDERDAGALVEEWWELSGDGMTRFRSGSST
jgi:molybdate transport system ATP-binding protein